MNDNLKLKELESKIDSVIEILSQLKDGWCKKYYTTREFSEATGIGKSVIDRLRVTGELSYSKIGQTYIFSKEDVEGLIKNNRVSVL